MGNEEFDSFRQIKNLPDAIQKMAASFSEQPFLCKSVVVAF